MKEYNNFKNLYRYKYDKLNNVTHIYENDILSKKYYYDVYNQLIKEKDYSSNTLKFFDYDNDGNIISKRTYDLTSFNLLSKLNYEYDDDSWKDKLTKINDKNIVYDNSGNPISIGNDITLNWVNGKQLIQYSDSNNIINYEYNVFGLRKSKSVNGFKTEYKYDDTKLIYEKNNINEIYYYYDVFDSIIGFKLNNTSYYYLKNKFNDVVGILDENNSILYEYEYDAWGNILKIVDSFGNDVSNSNCIANINPFRYRSYYYDVETKMYYLNNRYYNPKWARFINPDSFVVISNNISTYNMFSYSFNNPISFDDYSGNLGKTLKNIFKKAKKMVVSAAKAVKKKVVNIVKKVATVVKNVVTGKTPIIKSTTKDSKKVQVYSQKDFIVDSSVNVTHSTTY